MFEPNQHIGYAPTGLPQSHHALPHLTHAAGQPTQAGHNLAIQAWAGHNLLATGNQRLTATRVPLDAHTMLALGVSHLSNY